MIHCALCLHDPGDLYKSVYCTLLSCFENASESIHVHVLADSSIDETQHWLEELCADTGNSISFYKKVPVPGDILDIFPGNTLVSSYTEASLFRMCLHEVLPADVDKVVYFDTDIIFERDIAELWRKDFDGAWIIATHDASRV